PQSYEIRLAIVLSSELPDVEACHGQNAALAVDPRSSTAFGGLDATGLDARSSLPGGMPLDPGRNEAPSQHHAFALFIVQPDRGHVLLCRYVESCGKLPPHRGRQKLAFRGNLVW